MLVIDPGTQAFVAVYGVEADQGDVIAGLFNFLKGGLQGSFLTGKQFVRQSIFFLFENGVEKYLDPGRLPFETSLFDGIL